MSKLKKVNKGKELHSFFVTKGEALDSNIDIEFLNEGIVSRRAFVVSARVDMERELFVLRALEDEIVEMNDARLLRGEELDALFDEWEEAADYDVVAEFIEENGVVVNEFPISDVWFNDEWEEATITIRV